jgi:predicted AlkP superfamily phosphohydrolase/phosphomutase
MSRPWRLLVLGFDAANPDLIRRWAADGTLPNLRALMDRGLMGETRTVPAFIHSTWPSFYTGAGPDRHGFHYVAQLKPATYEYQWTPVRCEPFWTVLSRARRRVAVFDVPLCQPDPAINGVHVVDWGAVENWSTFQTVPASVRSRILSEWGSHPLEGRSEDLRTSAEAHLRMLDDLRRGARTRAEIAREYLGQGGWDVFTQVFTESHCAGHNQWHLHEPSHPSHDREMAARIGDPIRAVYVEIDAAMGRLIEAAGEATVLVVSAHGMSHWYGSEFLLIEILCRLGAAERRPVRPAPEPPLPSKAAEGARALWRLAPEGVREHVFALRQRMRPRKPHVFEMPTLRVDPNRSRCLLVRNGHLASGLRLNLAGREPGGLLAPGDEADRFVDGLTCDLLEIVDERSGRPILRRVIRTRDVYAGPRAADLPDLVLEWDDSLATGNSNIAGGAGATVRVHSPKIGVLEGTNHYTRTGDHRQEGFFIAAGPGIRPGRLERTVSVMDLAPTITRLVGVDLPEADGLPIEEIASSAS